MINMTQIYLTLLGIVILSTLAAYWLSEGVPT